MRQNVNYLRQWKSPEPYLYGGLAIVFGVIGLALFIVACFRRCKSSPESLCEAKEESKEVTSTQIEQDDPKILVIVAGDYHPTYLAKPVPLPHSM